MGFLSRKFVPRGVRRAAHPVRSAKRAATPKSIKKARRALHPVSNASYSVTRSLQHQAATDHQISGIPPRQLHGEPPVFAGGCQMPPFLLVMRQP